MKNKKRLEFIYKAALQLDVIMLLFTWLFAIIPHSIYYERWDDAARAFVRTCNIINAVAMPLLIVITIYCAVRLKKFKKPDSVLVWSVIIFAVHILIRVNMLGSYQWADACEYFYKIDFTMYYPNNLMFDPLHGGTICSHIAHGFFIMSMLGQFINTPTGMGFQYSYMVMGAVAAVCIFNIIRVVLPKRKSYVCAIAALAVSFEPMFLGLSTSMQMEYPFTILFIYALCAFLYRKYILMFFWLVMLGTCKETGTMMAFALLFFAVVYLLAEYVKKSGGIKSALKKIKVWQYAVFGVFVAACIFVFVKILFMPAWGGVRIIDVLKIGGEGRLNFQFEKSHFLLKFRQLYILNFSWLWVIIIAVCGILMAVVPAVKKRPEINRQAFSFILIQYGIYTFFLLFFLEAKGTRYNILSSVLLLLIAVTMLVRVLDRWFAYLPASVVVGGLALAETFLTIDPVTLSVFTSVNTGGWPMVWTAATKAELPLMDVNTGDFGYYNYQFAYMDKAVDNMLESVGYQGWYRIVSSFQELEEDQFKNDFPVWDSKLKLRTYKPVGDEEARYHSIERVYYTEVTGTSDTDRSNIYPRCIYVELPWCRNHYEEARKALGKYYIFEGPYTSSVGNLCSLTYYIMYLK